MSRPTELAMTLLMTPEMANFRGNVHGGSILKLLDQVAYACASRYAGYYVVTISLDQVTFKQPVHVGELVTFFSRVNYTGITSMEIGVKVVAENVTQGLVRHTNSCYFTMVAIGDNGRPIAVPPLVPADRISEQRCRAAALRKQRRLELASEYETLKHEIADQYERFKQNQSNWGGAGNLS